RVGSAAAVGNEGGTRVQRVAHEAVGFARVAVGIGVQYVDAAGPVDELLTGRRVALDAEDFGRECRVIALEAIADRGEVAAGAGFHVGVHAPLALGRQAAHGAAGLDGGPVGRRRPEALRALAEETGRRIDRFIAERIDDAAIPEGVL